MAKKRDSGASTQRIRILEALRCRPHTSYELRKLGCYQANTRVLELRRMGYGISTKRVSIVDDEGYRHDGIALYILSEGCNVVVVGAHHLTGQCRRLTVSGISS